MPPRSLLLVCMCLCLVVPSARADDDPPLSIDTDDVALAHPADLSGRPVLLVHGTDTNTAESWPRNHVPALTREGFSVFTIDLPWRALADIQVSSEHVVHAVRTIHALTGRPVSVIGHSQGGLEPRWALRWWPSLRGITEDVVTLASPHHGTVTGDLYCTMSPCSAAHWQMTTTSRFLTALNAGDETPGDVDYTAISSVNDELVQPQSSTRLDGGSNVSVQDVCPRPVNHSGMLRDPVVYALILDALTHDGPADPSRIGDEVCTQVTMPGIGPADSADPDIQFVASFTRLTADGHPTQGEPELRDYARG